MATADVPQLTEGDVYNFDTAGILHLRGVLPASEQQAAAAAVQAAGHNSADLGDVARALLEKPALRTRLVQLVAAVPDNGDVWGDQAFLSQGSAIDGKTGELTLQTGAAATLTGGKDEEALVGGPGEDGVLDFTRTYLYEAGHRYVHGIVVVWAVGAGETTGGYACVPGSHKGTLAVPGDLRSVDGSAPLTSLGILQQPPLESGDVLLISSAALHGARMPEAGGCGPQLLRCEFLSHMARMDTAETEGHDTEREPDWTQELTDVERTVIGLEPQHRTADDGHPTVHAADGQAWLVDDSPGAAPHHPTALVENDSLDPSMKEDMWLWETCGYLILRGVMDADWISEANATIDWALGTMDDPGLLGNPISLPKPHCLPFRKMVAYPAVLERLAWIFGSGFVHYAPAPVRLVDPQSGGGRQRIHAGQMDRSCDYHQIKIVNGRSYCASVNVSWQLADHCEFGGGLHVVPGSHRANYLLPATLSVHPVTNADGPLPDCAVHPDTRAGDVVIFSGMGTGHGVGAWQSEHQRRIVIMGYISNFMAIVGGHYGSSNFLTPHKL